MKKKLLGAIVSIALVLGAVMPFNVTTFAQGESIISSGVWYESMYVEWSGNSITDYSVLYKEASADDSAYKSIDAELIREVEPGKFRADIIGIKGDIPYKLKLTDGGSVISEFTGTPKAYDRSGFAFDDENNAPGAYNMDGTLPDEALVIYVTDDNKKEVYDGKSLVYVLGNLNTINNGNPVDIRIIGKVNQILPNDFQVGMFYNTCGVTIEGVGPEAGFSKWGMNIEFNEDIEIRNLIVADTEEDAFGFYRTKKLWLHNNTIYTGYAPLDDSEEQDKLHGDGSCDLRECDKVTVSYNHFNSTDKTSLMGSSAKRREPTGSFTFHHNFFDRTGQRTPRVRWHNVHVYNNYYYGTEIYGVAATNNANIFAENNYFEDAASPFLISSQSEFTSKFSTNDGGAIKAYNNTMVNTRECAEGLDYFNAPSREYRLTPEDFTSIKGGFTYNNFDAEGYIGAMDYILDTPEQAKKTVLEEAGAMSEAGILTADRVSPVKVSGTPTDKYYYDPSESGSTGESYGGVNGAGTYFKGAGVCKEGTVTGYRIAEEYNYSGSYNSSSDISFTTTAPSKFTIVAGAATEVPERAILKDAATGESVYHGTFQTGYKGGHSITTIDLPQAGTYSFKPTAAMDIYYIEVQEYAEDK